MANQLFDFNSPSANLRRKKQLCCCLSVIAILFVIITASLSYVAYRKNGQSKVSNIEKTQNPVLEKSREDQQNLPSEKQEPIERETETEKPAQPSPAIETSQNSATKEQMTDFFIELATMNHNKTAQWGVGRWRGNITIGIVEGVSTEGFNSGLSDLINNFNSVSRSTKLVRSDSNPKIKIYILPSDEIFRRSDGRESHAHAYYNAGDDCYLYSATVYLEENPEFSDYLEYITVRHEVTHALGFLGHSDIFPNSIMAIFHSGYSFPYEDSKLIDMMYNSGLPVCSREPAIREFFDKNFTP